MTQERRMADIEETRPKDTYAPMESRRMVIPFADSTIAAGFPSPSDDGCNQLDIAAHLVRRPESTYFMRVSGESMLGAGIFDGDLLVVDRSIAPKSGDIVVAIVNNDFTVKRFYQKGSKIELLAENPRFKKIPIIEGTELEIWGVVTNSIRSHR